MPRASHLALRFAWPFGVLALVLALAACAPPPDELYRRGQELEVQGRYEDAVDHYVRALEREPSMRKAQGRLHVAGGALLDRYLQDAARAPDAPARADAYHAAAVLADRTAAVGVPLVLPPAFESDRADAFDAAVEALLAEGADALDAGRFQGALAAFDRAGRYDPDPEQAGALATFSFDTHLAWAEADLAAGRFRAALAHAEAAVPFAGAGRDAAEARALQAAVLDAGTIPVAVFPVEDEGGRATAEAPRGFLGAFDDLLEDEFWRRPPPFVGVLDPSEVRRRLRRTYDAGERLQRLRFTADLTRDLRAGFGVPLALRSFDGTTEEVGRDTLAAGLREGGQARYVRVEERLTRRAEAEFAVVEARSARVVCGETVRAEASGRLFVGEYEGRPRELLLDRDDRALFDPEARAEVERRVEDELRRELAARLAERVFACLGRQVR